MSARSSVDSGGIVHFPLFERFDVDDFGLYPGTPDNPGLHVEFLGGLTLIVGTNGLGKTTLVTMLYRMMSGGFELRRGTLEAEELGGAQLDVIRLKRQDRMMFGKRVNDLAVHARATLKLRLGASEVVIVRRLDNLGLITFTVDGVALDTRDEKVFQATMLGLAGLSSFGDWLIFLRQMVFYFEDRRSLVWDPSAQRQMFRILFLSPDEARDLYALEREYLKLDSDIRNNTAALNRLTQRVAQDEVLEQDSGDVRARIQAMVPVLETDIRRKQSLVDKHDQLDVERRDLRRDLLAAETEVARLEDEIEETRLRLVFSRFPDGSATAKYLVSMLMAEGHCAVCHAESPELSIALVQRSEEGRCVLCGSDDSKLQAPGEPVHIDMARLDADRAALEKHRTRIDSVQVALRDAADRHRSLGSRIIELTEDIRYRQEQLEALTAMLPADEEKQIAARDQLGALGDKIADDKRTLQSKAEKLTASTNALNALTESKSEAIKDAFSRYAQDFLYEKASLKWQPQKRRIGQLQRFMTASFELEMSGTDFQEAQRRTGPEAVSESQREFIDLAFRMAIIEVAGQAGVGSLVIDAPESSLDAVFVDRAAGVLSNFGKPTSASRLIIASNLIDGKLLPQLIRRGIPRRDLDTRIVNLLKIAVPTSALHHERKAYEAEWDGILEEAGLG